MAGPRGGAREAGLCRAVSRLHLRRRFAGWVLRDLIYTGGDGSPGKGKAL